jgi:hypothetical protein
MSATPRTAKVLIPAGLLVAATVGLVLWLAWPRHRHDGEQGPAPVDLADGSRAKALALGLTLPEGGSHVYIKARAQKGVTVRYLRFELPTPRYREFREELARRPGADMSVAPFPPQQWPRFRELAGLGPPDWFTAYLKTSSVVAAAVGPRRPSGGELLEGEFWVLDDSNARVFLWSWVCPRAMAPGLQPPSIRP